MSGEGAWCERFGILRYWLPPSDFRHCQCPRGDQLAAGITASGMLTCPQAAWIQLGYEPASSSKSGFQTGSVGLGNENWVGSKKEKCVALMPTNV